MLTYTIDQISNTVNGYKVEDIILWTFGLFLSVISIVFSMLSYYFSNKSTKMISELMAKTWSISEADKFFSINMKIIKKSNLHALSFLKENQGRDISYDEYNSSSIGTRIIHINNEAAVFLSSTKYSHITNLYMAEKKICDEMFFQSVPIEKITSSSKEIITNDEVHKLIQYHNNVLKFTSLILKEYTLLTTI